jgi:hypothetical protein
MTTASIWSAFGLGGEENVEATERRIGAGREDDTPLASNINTYNTNRQFARRQSLSQGQGNAGLKSETQTETPKKRLNTEKQRTSSVTNIQNSLSLTNSVNQPSESRLSKLIKRKDWDRVARRCLDSPSEAAIWIVENSGNLQWRLLPLHQACELRAPEHVLQLVLQSYPEAASERDTANNLPIHLACRELTSGKTVDELIGAFRKGVELKDSEGRLPLHLSCRKGTSKKTVETLLKVFYRGAQLKDMEGMLPIHWACSEGATPEIVEILLHAYPASVRSKDKLGRTPLNVVQASRHRGGKDIIMGHLKKDEGYWAMSLQDEATSLKVDLHKKMKDEENIKSLLSKVRSEATKSNESLENCRLDRNKLAEENEAMKKLVDGLQSQLQSSNQEMETIGQRNKNLEDQVSRLSGILKEMSKHQKALLGASQSMQKLVESSSDALQI